MIETWVSGLIKDDEKGDSLQVNPGKTLASTATENIRMSKLEGNMDSQKDYLMEIKSMMKFIINRQGNGKHVSIPPIFYKPHYNLGGWGT